MILLEKVSFIRLSQLGDMHLILSIILMGELVV